MASCDHWFYAEDQDGNYPSAVDPEFTLRNYTTKAIIGTYTIPSYGLKLTLDNAIKYTAIPHLSVSDVDWVRPDDVDFYGCAKDVVFVYAKKEAIGGIVNISSPATSKSGDNVTIYVQSWNKGDVSGLFQVKLYDSDTGAHVHTFTERTLNPDASINELAYPYPVMPSKRWNLAAKLYVNRKTAPDDTKSFTIDLETVIGNGFTIRVSNALATKNVLVAHVVKMPFIGLVGPDPNLWYWPQAFDYVGGKWYTTDPATKYRVEVGSIFETIPSFDKTYGTGSFANGIHCVVLAEGEGGVGSLIFKGEDVFQLFKDSPTEIYLSSTSTDVLTEAVMGPVCDFFGIPRGSQCNSFWAEFSDPVFIANYVSILRTGKDTLGNSRELSVFDHLALPFAIIGVVAPQVPFGRFISKGLEGLWMGGRVFTDAAFNWMKTVTINVPPSMHLDKSTLTFMEAIVKLNPDTHIDEVMSMIADGHYDDALSRIHQYLPGDFGSVDWWKYQKFNDALKNYLPPAQFDQLMGMIHGFGPQADTIIGVVKQTYLSADDLAKIASASKYPQIMDEATLAIYRSIRNLDVASATKIDELRNILKNSPEISNRLIASYKSILDKVASGQRVITREEIKTIFHHADLAPDDIVELVKTSDNLALIVSKLTDGAYSQALGNFLDSTKKYWDYVNTQVGKTEADTFVRNNARIARKALDTNDPAKMADIPHAAQEIAAKQDSIIDEAVAGTPEVSKVDAEDIIFGDGMKVGNEIGEVTQVFADEVPTNWYTKARQTANIIPDRIKKKWKSLTRFEKVLVIWFTVDNMAFNVWMLAKFLGLAPGDRGFDAWNLGKSVTAAGWLCKVSCEDKRYGDLANDITILEGAIIDLEDFLDRYESSLKLENNYNAPHSILEIGKAELKLYQECLVNGGIEVAPSTGKIEFICVDKDQQPIIASAYVDGWKVGVVWESGLLIEEVNPATYDLKMYAGGYTECTKTVSVAAGGYVIFKCVMEPIGVCRPVTDVKIYIDPLSPVTDETVSFNGSANSDDPITSWEWNFGDGFTATGQAVTHSYKYADVYKVELTVTNDCEEYATATRNVTVSEEAPGTGTIHCTSNQTGFAVYVDDVYIGHSYGNSYLVVTDVTPGSRKVKIEKGFGYTPQYCEETITVIDGGITDFDCQMVKTVEPTESTNLMIEIPIGTDGKEIYRYWDIEIWVDGKLTECDPPHTLTFGTDVHCDCAAPWNLVDCELGQHTITLKKYGYSNLSKTFTFVKDVPQTWESPVMEVRLELIYLRSNQTGFDGYMDGVYIGNSGTSDRLTIYDLIHGTTHRFKISKGPGYSPEYCEKDILIERRAEFYCEMHPVTTHDVDLVIPVGAKLWVDGKLIEATTVARLTAIFNDLRK